jgi:hypothetical protein
MLNTAAEPIFQSYQKKWSVDDLAEQYNESKSKKDPKIYLELADLGYAPAQYKYAKANFGVPAICKMYLHLSAVQGYPKALHTLAIIYLDTPEIIKQAINKELGLHLLELANLTGYHKAKTCVIVRNFHKIKNVAEARDYINQHQTVDPFFQFILELSDNALHHYLQLNPEDDKQLENWNYLRNLGYYEKYNH